MEKEESGGQGGGSVVFGEEVKGRAERVKRGGALGSTPSNVPLTPALCAT